MFKNQDNEKSSKSYTATSAENVHQNMWLIKMINHVLANKRSIRSDRFNTISIKPLININDTKQLILKSKFTTKAIFLCVSAVLFMSASKAQVVTLNGPSDITTNPPANASAVSQVIKAGTSISIKIGSAASGATDIVYQWYKIDNAGVKQLVQSSNSPVFTETSTDAGYYIYQLLISNSNQCTSEISDPFKIYVLPALNPAIAASAGTVCSNGTSTSVLSATVGDSKYTYQYQWVLNGTDISGATGAVYTTTPANTSGNKTYSVKVAYALSSAITGTANQVINAIPVPTKPLISVGQ